MIASHNNPPSPESERALQEELYRRIWKAATRDYGQPHEKHTAMEHRISGLQLQELDGLPVVNLQAGSSRSEHFPEGDVDVAVIGWRFGEDGEAVGLSRFADTDDFDCEIHTVHEYEGGRSSVPIISPFLRTEAMKYANKVLDALEQL